MPASDYQYWLGKEQADLKAVGKRGVVRRDADDKATGKALYTRDLKLPRMLYVRVMMCPYPHAKIKSMDTSAAEALPGVKAVLRYDDSMVTQRIFNPWDPDIVYLAAMPDCCVPFYILGPEAWYEGAPLGVAIAADDLDIADEAMELVKVEWEVLDFAVDYTKALASGAPRVYEHLDSYDANSLFPYRLTFGGNYGSENITVSGGWKAAANANNVKCITEFSLPGADITKGFAAADQTIEFTFNRTEVIGVGPEILSTMAQWTDNGNIEIWQGGESPPNVALYSIYTGVEADKFVVHDPYAGAQFGGWDGMPVCPQGSQIPIAVWLSKKTSAPVKVVFQRKDERWGEMDEGTFDIKVGFKKDGTITAIDMKNQVAQCADAGFIPETCGGGHIFESTQIADWHGVTTTAFVNKSAFGASRCEQQIDAHCKQQIFSRVADALGVDEGTIETVNNGNEGHDLAWVSQFKNTNKIPDIDSLGVVLPAAKDLAGWNAKFHAPGAKTLANGHLHGMCMGANHQFSNGGAPSSANLIGVKVTLTVNDGKVYLVGSRPDCGVDGRTGYSRIVAEETGMKIEDVKYDRQWEANPSQPTTELNGGGGSVVFTMNCWPVLAIARQMKQKMLAVAASTLKIDASDLDIVDSMVVQKSNTSNATAVAAVLALEGATARWNDVDWSTLNMPDPPASPMMISRCVNIVEVEVDPETGAVDVINAVQVNDVGQPISPETVEGQMYGGAIMGLSTGAIEEVVYDASTGVRLNPNFIDYKIFTILDAPTVSYKMLTSRMGYGPYGACGTGEDDCTFDSPMVIPAVYNATGVWVDTYPPTPERVLKALGKG